MAGITRDLELINKNYVLHSVKIINTRDTTIPEHFFGNTTLKFVEFSMPKLKSIPNKLFEEQRNSVKGVSVINSSLSEIPIEMLSVANVLKTIQISESKLFKVVRSNVFKPLKAKLSSLVLSYNSISTIEPGAFNGLDNLQLLNISGNDLKIISADSFPVQLPRLFIEIFSMGFKTLRKYQSNMVRKSTATPMNIFIHFMLNLKAVEGLTANQKQKTNEWVLDKMENPENLLTTISRSKMSFVGHIFRSNDIGKDLLMGTVYGNRGRDNKTRYSDNIKEIGGGRSFVALCRMAQDRVSWRATAVQFEPTKLGQSRSGGSLKEFRIMGY
ncbi:Toll-like receptor 6 [Nymphon striatum]|nr:Toll-like receptor 6 [Nymphon striatum]